jgi:hypothetical protein
VGNYDASETRRMRDRVTPGHVGYILAGVTRAGEASRRPYEEKFKCTERVNRAILDDGAEKSTAGAKDKGVTENRAGLNGRPAPTTAKSNARAKAGPKTPTLPVNQDREGWGTQCINLSRKSR